MSSSLQVRKSILRSRAIEFTRLAMLSMLEEANDTFSAMLMVLGSELGQSNLSTDQFLQTFSELIEELRLKITNKDDGDNNSATNSRDFNTFNLPKSNGNGVVLDDEPGMRNVNGLQDSNRRPSETKTQVEMNSKQSCRGNITQKMTSMAGNQCNVCKNVVPPDQKFYFSLGLCQNCYAKGWENRQDANSDRDEIEHLPDRPMRVQDSASQFALKVCKRCWRPLAESSMKSIFNGHCSLCYYKTRRLNRSKPYVESSKNATSAADNPPDSNLQLGDRQCSDCKKIVSKGRVFYRSTHLCKNCYERHRVHIRKSNKKQCSACKKLTNEEMLSGKCVPCYYQQVHIGESSNANLNNEPHKDHFDEHQNDGDSLNSTDKINSWIDSIQDNEQNSGINGDVEMLLNLCKPGLSRCSACKERVASEELSESGKCGSCRHNRQNSAISIKSESPD